MNLVIGKQTECNINHDDFTEIYILNMKKVLA